MGVHKLWEILEPVKQVVPLEQLAGQCLCIDLSYWIIQLNKVNGGNVKDKPHLRGLFHRIRALLALNCHLVFVADGAIPEVKADTYNQRLANNARLVHGEKRAPGSLRRNNGSDFGRMVEESKALIAAFGLPCLTSVEEAEAQCADLNAMGLCDACCTADSDALLFGAQLVYKDISLGRSGEPAHVIAYDMSNVRQQLGYGRKTLIALGILLGCDYFPGVRGLGPEKAQQLVKRLGEERVLELLCNEGLSGLGTRLAKTDDDAARRAVHGYTNPACHPRKSDIVQNVVLCRPVQMGEIRKICSQNFEWPHERTDEYVLNKLAERDVQKMASMRLIDTVCETDLQYRILSIVKSRKLQGVEYYEVEWSGQPAISRSNVRCDVVKRACPCKIQEFIARLNTKAKKPRTRVTKTIVPASEELVADMNRLSLHPPSTNELRECLQGEQPSQASRKPRSKVKETIFMPDNLVADINHPPATTVPQETTSILREISNTVVVEVEDATFAQKLRDRLHGQQPSQDSRKIEFIDLTTPPKPMASCFQPDDGDDDVYEVQVKQQPTFHPREEQGTAESRAEDLRRFIARLKGDVCGYYY